MIAIGFVLGVAATVALVCLALAYIVSDHERMRKFWDVLRHMRGL